MPRPLLFPTCYEVVDDGLGAVGEITKLGLGETSGDLDVAFLFKQKISKYLFRKPCCGFCSSPKKLKNASRRSFWDKGGPTIVAKQQARMHQKKKKKKPVQFIHGQVCAEPQKVLHLARFSFFPVRPVKHCLRTASNLSSEEIMRR